jgi:hypothetical protein
MRIHFGSGGNFLHFYLGVAAKMQLNRLDIKRLSGVSAGTFAAAFLAYHIDINKEYKNWNLRLCKELDKNEKTIDSFLKVTEPLFINKKCEIPLDIWTSKIQVPYITSHRFCGKEDLFDKMACSCYIPIFCPNKTLLYRYKDEYYIDGVITFDKEKDYNHVINYKNYIKDVKMLDKLPSSDVEKNQKLYELGKDSFDLRLIHK